MFDQIKSWLGFGSLSDDQFERQRKELLKKIPVPVFWLFGKTGSGKSSIIRYLTGSSLAEIGNGFRPQTRTSFEYDFPSASEPLVRFLDTRGLGEAGYEPTEDLKAFDQSTHVVIVVARVMDHALAEVIAPLRTIRARTAHASDCAGIDLFARSRTRLSNIPDPDPFAASMVSHSSMRPRRHQRKRPDRQCRSQRCRVSLKRPSLLAAHPVLQRSLREHEERFAGLVDRIIPIDLTRPEEGFNEPNFGGSRLEETLIELLPAACRQALLHLDDLRNSLRDLTAGAGDAHDSDL